MHPCSPAGGAHTSSFLVLFSENPPRTTLLPPRKQNKPQSQKIHSRLFPLSTYLSKCKPPLQSRILTRTLTITQKSKNDSSCFYPPHSSSPVSGNTNQTSMHPMVCSPVWLPFLSVKTTAFYLPVPLFSASVFSSSNSETSMKACEK